MRRYINSFQVPKSVGAGRVLCHNHVRHTIDMPCDEDGFRAWTDTKLPAGFIKCPCGWSGLPHFALRAHVKATKGRCTGVRDPETKRLTTIIRADIAGRGAVGYVLRVGVRKTLTPADGVKCPTCGARPGVKCRSWNRLSVQSGKPSEGFQVHAKRILVYRRSISVFKPADRLA